MQIVQRLKIIVSEDEGKNAFPGYKGGVMEVQVTSVVEVARFLIRRNKRELRHDQHTTRGGKNMLRLYCKVGGQNWPPSGRYSIWIINQANRPFFIRGRPPWASSPDIFSPRPPPLPVSFVLSCPWNTNV